MKSHQYIYPKTYIIFLYLLTIILSCICTFGDVIWAQDLGGSVLRDYPSALTVPKGRFEISLDYLTADLPENESQIGTGDLPGFRLLANYGLLHHTTIMSAFTYQTLKLGIDELKIFSADLSLKRNLISWQRGWIPKLSINAGIRTNMALDEDRILVDVNPGNDDTTHVSIYDLKDNTAYARFTAGQIVGRLFPHLFLEYGHSNIYAKADFATKEVPPGFSHDLGRNEDYLKTGISFLIKFPYKSLLHLEYDYLKIFRDQELDEVDDNHILKADINYYLTPSMALNLGWQYNFHQLNGQIPFLYQEFNQENFDQKYNCLKFGLTFLFGGKQ
jgi:hypothetical protein